jgi:hypothetical protein
MATNKWTNHLTEENLADQIEQARAKGHRANQEEPRATSVQYASQENLVIIQLKNGASFSFPPDLVEGLGNATPEVLQDFWMPESGDSIHWEQLEVSFSIPGLLAGIFGTKRWMAELGKAGGQATSPAKARSSADNGKKGGRPRKKMVVVP